MLRQNNQEKESKRSFFFFFSFLCSGDGRWELSKPDKGDLRRNCGEGTSPRQRSGRSPPLLEQAAGTWRNRRHFARLDTWSSANQARTELYCYQGCDIFLSLSLSLSVFVHLCSFVAFIKVNEPLVSGAGGSSSSSEHQRFSFKR